MRILDTQINAITKARQVDDMQSKLLRKLCFDAIEYRTIHAPAM